jgi:uncharacterized protein YjeT (DUF2065 family)
MEKSSGATFIGLGIVLVIAGAVMRYAVTVSTEGFDIHTAGVIALIAGLVSVAIGLLLLMWPSRRRSVTTDRYVNTPDGQERVQERDDIGTI